MSAFRGGNGRNGVKADIDGLIQGRSGARLRGHGAHQGLLSGPDLARRAAGKILAGRFGALEDLVGTTVLLYSHASRYVTGRLHGVDLAAHARAVEIQRWARTAPRATLRMAVWRASTSSLIASA
jgi:hypothetical protein